ncbi:hypothetical protein PanWU01x14_255930 [Parasponia andersonii]|uniref:Uncharacterized protein n=1 Tax=Parasponia andersonii TaxID=3476 RepID=A0A2P5BAJ1_PARAD|nr:hypothetical protein PanWU01x14_255930 [Parasponia andersonii]
MATCGVRGLSVYNLISPYYKKAALQATYIDIVRQINSPSNLTFPNEVVNLVVEPLVITKIHGRPKNTRIESTREDSAKQKCSRYGNSGHNRQMCHNPIPLRNTINEAADHPTRILQV